MKYGDSYQHFKGGEYFFDCIALPKQDTRITEKAQKQMEHSQNATYHDGTHQVKLYKSGGATFIDSDVPHVIYQSKKDENSTKVYAREVDDFFGYKDKGDEGLAKRFSLQK